MTSPLVQAVALRRYFTDGSPFSRARAPVHAVEEVSLEIHAGQTLGIVGESGCGKSTLGRLLLRLLEPTSGKVLFQGRDLASLSEEALRQQRRWMQIIFQDPYASLHPRMRLVDAVAEPLLAHFPELSAPERSARAAALLERVGLGPELGGRWPGELSGGQRQRVVIARALSASPSFIVADEPVSALDVSIQAQILNLLRDLQQERQLGMAFISHDLKVVEQLCSEVAVMYLGRIVEQARTESLFHRPLHPYTEALVSAVPRVRAAPGRKRVLLGGEPPSPRHPPSGCPFHPRCPLRPRLSAPEQRRCKQELPDLAPVRGEATRRSACHFADRMA